MQNILTQVQKWVVWPTSGSDARRGRVLAVDQPELQRGVQLR